MERLFLASLRGEFGDWVYYPCLMKLKDIARRIRFADEIYKSKNLRKMVQRKLKDRWGREIGDYLLNEEQRFFNSLIVAVYDGEPRWCDITDLQGNEQLDASEIPNDVVASIGFLRLSGNEQFFTLDGQHRLMGIRHALRKNSELGEDELAVIFIAHRTDEVGMQRSRRLFTTLNKNAKRVSKSDIIALDEDDTMAIIVRRLIESHPMFQEDRVSYNATANLPKGNFKSLTTIVNLYDVLLILFTKINGKQTKKKLTEKRSPDEVLKDHYEYAYDYFKHLANTFEPLQEFLEAGNGYPTVTSRYRTAKGGHMLFRPIGLLILTEIVATLVQEYEVSECMTMIYGLPQRLTDDPLRGVIWNSTRNTINGKGKTLARNLLLYMLDAYGGDKDELHEHYAKALEKEKHQISLPQQV